MKKITLAIACISLLSLVSCGKKDRKCECTDTYTDSQGAVHTDPAPTETTYKKISKHDAKTLCQKASAVYVDDNSETTKYESDCKLK